MGSQLLEEGTSDSGEDGIRWEIDRADGGRAVGGLDPEQRPTGTARPTLILGVAGGDRRGGATGRSPPSRWGGNGPAGWPILRPCRGNRRRRRPVRAAAATGEDGGGDR